MSNQLAVQTDSFAITSLDEAMRYSKAVADAGIVPDAFKRQPANILVAQEIAKAINESVWVTMSEMSIISGKPSFSAKFMRSRVRQAGHRLRESFDKTTGTARAVIIRNDDPDFEHVAEWDRAKAEAHGLWGKGHWKKNPELMLKNRALSEVVREACYEVMGGVAYTPDEVQDFQPEPHRVKSERVQEPTQKQAQQHIREQLQATPVEDGAPEEAKQQVKDAETVDDLNRIYEAHKAEPYWAELKPLLSERKKQLEAEAIADQADDMQPALDAEVVE